MPDFTDPEGSMKAYGLSVGALPGLKCMVKIEELCTEIRKCGIDSAGLARALNSVHGEIWDQLLEKFERRPTSKRAPKTVSQKKPDPATVPPSTDPFTSW